MKKFLIPIVLVAATASLKASDASVSWGAQAYNGFASATGTALPSGDLAEVGYFDISDATIQANASNYSFLSSNFTLFGTSTIEANESGYPGYFAQTSTASTEALNLVGKQIYFWVFNASTATAATQQGIFYFVNTTASSARDSAWTFKDDAANPNTSNPDIADLTGNSNSLVAGADVVVGTFGPGTISNPVAGAKAFQLAAIPTPEPGTAGLAIVGGVAMLIRRRRRA